MSGFDRAGFVTPRNLIIDGQGATNIEAAIARAIQGGSWTKARFIKGRERQETRRGMGKINTEAKFRGQECYGLGEILPERPRVEIRIAETNRNGICRQSRVIRLRWCATDSGRTNQGGRNIEEDGTHRENKAWRGRMRMGGDNMRKGIIVIQIVDPGFVGGL